MAYNGSVEAAVTELVSGRGGGVGPLKTRIRKKYGSPTAANVEEFIGRRLLAAFYWRSETNRQIMRDSRFPSIRHLAAEFDSLAALAAIESVRRTKKPRSPGALSFSP